MLDSALLLNRLTDTAFRSLGSDEFAYLKPIELPDGEHVIGVFSAAGEQVGSAPSIEVAAALIRQNELEPALVH